VEDNRQSASRFNGLRKFRHRVHRDHRERRKKFCWLHDYLTIYRIHRRKFLFLESGVIRK